MLVADQQSPDSDENTLTLSIEDIADPEALESGVLDIDGRVSRADRSPADRTKSSRAAAASAAQTSHNVSGADLSAHRAWKVAPGDYGGSGRTPTLGY